MTTLFPKNIFQVWFQGCDQIQRKEFIENMNTWKRLNPDWIYKCCSDTDLRKACADYSDRCAAVYDSLPVMHMKIDLGRYVLIYNHGGIYADMDAYALRSLNYSDDLRNIIQKYEKTQVPVLAITKANISWIESFLSGVYYNNAFMVCSPKNIIMKKFIDYVLDQCEKNKNMGFQYNAVQHTTGPVSFSRFFIDLNKDNAMMHFVELDHDVIEPCNLNKICRINKKSIAAHQFEMSWVTPTTKSFIDMYLFLLDYSTIVSILCLCFLFLFFSWTS